MLACVTEQTHDIRVYGRVMVPDFLSSDVKLFPENSGKIRYYIYFLTP